MPSTEVVVLALKADSNIGDPASPGAAVLKEALGVLASAPGAQKVSFGTFVESPDTLQIFVDWDKVDDFHTFLKSETYPNFFKSMISLAASKPVISHVDFKPDGGLAQALSAPVTEVASFYFGTEQAPPGFDEGSLKFLSTVLKGNVDGYFAGGVGVTTYDVEKDGVKGKGAVLVMGWTSVDAHMAFRETQVFKDNIGVFRSGVEKAEVHHTPFMRFVE